MATESGVSSLSADGHAIERVLEPESVEELQDTVRAAGLTGSHLLIAGGATRMAFGNHGGQFDAVVSTRKLNRIIDYEPEDLTVAIEPGVTLTQLDAVLGKHGQQLVIDGFDRERATVGGSFASGLSGPRRLRYGSLKESAIGIEVVQADGTRAKAGGMVVKNVTGYDMMRLHYGALGAFGVISRLNFKVVPRAAATLLCQARYGTAAQAYAAGVAMLGSGVELAALYIVARSTERWDLRALVDGNPVAAERQARHLLELAADLNATSASTEQLEGDPPGFAPFMSLAGNRIVARLSTPASRQLAVIERMAFSGSEELCADLGSGLVYLSTLPEIEWQVAIRRIDPRAVFLALPAELKTGVDVLAGEPGPAFEVLRRLKHEFDPSGRFNRGRFVGGL